MEKQQKGTAQKVVEIRIRHIKDLSDTVKDMVFEKVAGKPGFSGYAKVIYVEQSPRRIADVEPIMGNPLNELL